MSRKDNLFKQVPVQRVPRNLFDLSHEVKMSGKFGYLYPVLVMDTLPGDYVNEQMTAMVRFAPMLAPVMHRCEVTTHFFFVPNRLLTGDPKVWENFVTGGQDGDESPVLPYVTPNGIETLASGYMVKGTLWDYMGLPILGVAPDSLEQISALPFIAYNKICDDYYRDPTFDVEKSYADITEGDNSAFLVVSDMLSLRRRGWQKDYFTSALPWPQRGDEVLIPLTGIGEVTYLPSSFLVPTDGGVTFTDNSPMVVNDSGLQDVLAVNDNSTTVRNARVENIDDVTITNAETSINDLRLSLALQHWLEINARGGGRYVEQIKSHYDVTVPDFRLQRAEYLGGGKQPVTISQVLATAQSEDIPVGDMAGHGISVGKSNRFSYSCKEHGWIIGVMSITFSTAYSQGIDRMWLKKDRFDIAFPSFAHLGEQQILSKEIFFSGYAADQGDNDELFGYIPRYAEYKFKNDRIAGDFRDTLAFWHLGRLFEARPSLGSVFTTLNENDPTREDTYRRIFAVQDGTDYLWIQLFHRLTAKRPLPYFGVPKLIG